MAPRGQWAAARRAFCDRFAKCVDDPPQPPAKVPPAPSRRVTKPRLAPSPPPLVQRGPKARLQGAQAIRLACIKGDGDVRHRRPGLAGGTGVVIPTFGASALSAFRGFPLEGSSDLRSERGRVGKEGV